MQQILTHFTYSYIYPINSRNTKIESAYSIPPTNISGSVIACLVLQHYYDYIFILYFIIFFRYQYPSLSFPSSSKRNGDRACRNY